MRALGRIGGPKLGWGLLMRGRSVPFIRDELVISRDTVATHMKHIYAKTGVHSRQELLDLAN